MHIPVRHFSGMNLALFSISRLRLEVEAELGDRHASKILKMRRDSKFLLTTVLWGNVGINVLLTLLSNLVLAGVSAPMENHLPVFPNFEDTTTDPFLENIEVSGKKRVIITDNEGEPQFALDSDGFLRDVLFGDSKTMPFRYCHRPIVVKDTRLPLGNVLWRLKSHSRQTGRDVIDRDIILIWGKEEKRVITGAGILGRLLKGI